ncbi:solute carrier organic anion transporter family member 74D-like isoform X2 [Neocloeon triangulifer]|uniref:solute carrier organic anion transporter family member 74D-like isoform X2 n=1 Tax=Neocloeon triangulifer TaxID=2078957 RepID=UPI00286F63AD|nr:solute carrier organic anion transporter family member 74D-like isoform X2 [Neocloeon triangulifer]
MATPDLSRICPDSEPEESTPQDNLLNDQTVASVLEADLLEKETQCGVGFFRYPWLQKFASTKTYMLVYGLIGCAQHALGAFFVGTISTMEKRFQIPSAYSGLINCAWDIGGLVANLPLTYWGRAGHKPRWVAWGTAVVGLSCFIRLIPHWLYGPGDTALSLTREFGNEFQSLNASGTSGPKVTLCGNNHVEFEDCEHASSGNISALIFLASNLLQGVGGAVYYTLGISYLDDNAKKNKSPVLIAVSQCLGMIGPTFGFMLSSYALKMYVDPLLTPVITTEDTRWIGAWWFGWAPFGIICLLFASLMAMFPRSLPRATQRSMAAASAAGRSYDPLKKVEQSFSDFKAAILRLMKNKVLFCNNMSSVFFAFGLIGQWSFMPKYMETQFHQSASTASFISGSVGLLCTGAGVLVSALTIYKFKPNARILACWNVITEFVDFFGFIVIIFIGCETFNLQGTPELDGTLNLGVDCNANCSCLDSLRYSPVCHIPSKTTFFSPCHAGCQDASWNEENSLLKVFTNCTCVEGGGPIVDGTCPVDCNRAFMFFIIIQCVQRFLAATGRAGNTLIHFRCVDPEDKPLSIALAEFLLCVFAFIPGPIVFGYLIDLSCLVWGQTCGKPGNCWIYDVQRLRYLVNIPIVGLLFFGSLWDVGVWHYVKGLQLYDEEEGEKKESQNVDT